MIFKIYNEDKVFPYLVIDNFYNQKEQDLIWEELKYHKDLFKIDEGSPSYGVAWDENNKKIADLKRIYLDDIYKENRKDSNILSLYQKIISPEVLENYRHTTPSWRTFEITNTDSSLISYYENGDKYKEHFDSFMHSCLIWFYKEPKRFSGGDLKFTQPNKTVMCKHNRMILFPSYYLHEVDEVKMDDKYCGKDLGRYCITHFYNKE